MNAAWVAVIAALGSSLLTGLATFGVSWWTDRRRAVARKHNELAAAVGELLASSEALTHRFSTIMATGIQRSGIGEGVDQLLRLRKPLDPLELWDWVAPDFRSMSNALSRLWLVGDRELVVLANQVVAQCAGLMARWGDLEQPGPRGGALRKARLSPGAQERWLAEVNKLGELRSDLAIHARAILGVDVFGPRPSEPAAADSPSADHELSPP